MEGLELLARALENALISPNELDSNWESANIVDGLGKVARGLWAIAEAIDRLAVTQGAPPKETR